jgi:hypothetical protein
MSLHAISPWLCGLWRPLNSSSTCEYNFSRFESCASLFVLLTLTAGPRPLCKLAGPASAQGAWPRSRAAICDGWARWLPSVGVAAGFTCHPLCGCTCARTCMHRFDGQTHKHNGNEGPAGPCTGLQCQHAAHTCAPTYRHESAVPAMTSNVRDESLLQQPAAHTIPTHIQHTHTHTHACSARRRGCSLVHTPASKLLLLLLLPLLLLLLPLPLRLLPWCRGASRAPHAKHAPASPLHCHWCRRCYCSVDRQHQHVHSASRRGPLRSRPRRHSPAAAP